MITFIDGPAAGQQLGLRRAPVMLRVVQAKNGTWDALDQLEDEPRPGETIYLYRVVGQPRYMHILARGKNKKQIGGFWPVARYRFVQQQPADVSMRTTSAWRAWCDANKERLLQEFKAQDQFAEHQTPD